jgi:hypothetical protein
MVGRLIATLLFALTLCGCVSAPNSIISEQGDPQTVSVDSSLCLIVPPDASYQDRIYKDSGQRVANKVLNALEENYKICKVACGKELCASCKECDSNFAVFPEILYYEDRITGWSGRPDVIKVKTRLINLSTLQETTFTYSADSNTLVSGLFEWGNAAPCSLLGTNYKKQVLALVNGSKKNRP